MKLHQEWWEGWIPASELVLGMNAVVQMPLVAITGQFAFSPAAWADNKTNIGGT